MADIIHHEDTGTSGLLIIVIIILLAIGAFLLWRFLPKTEPQNPNSQPGIHLNINPGGGNATSSRY